MVSTFRAATVLVFITDIGDLLSVVIARDARKRPKCARMPHFLLCANGSRSTFIVNERSMPIADSDGMQRALKRQEAVAQFRIFTQFASSAGIADRPLFEDVHAIGERQ